MRSPDSTQNRSSPSSGRPIARSARAGGGGVGVGIRLMERCGNTDASRQAGGRMGRRPPDSRVPSHSPPLGLAPPPTGRLCELRKATDG
ncbi:hypothetical protein SKAU_G00130340 [Synaphobranchus kaupii]|uniref:Uncharacterized protein n=1 Tax=Synaphobranchus kaupii TaxID=118154 RepID=A0A9Q1J3A1_SYNKA|nr:hypothetical protein SKAU_G00130340 [Synaphobranchus kaupii]